MHEGLVSGGDTRVEKTSDCIRQRVWWPGMQSDIGRYVEVHPLCATRRMETKKLIAELKPFFVGTRFRRSGLDLGGSATLTKNSCQVSSSYNRVFHKLRGNRPFKDQLASTVDQSIIQHCFFWFGMPDSLHTDQGTEFCSKLAMDVCRLLGVD